MKTILRRHKTSDKLRTSYDRAISFDLEWNCPVPVRLFPRPTSSIRHFRIACSFCLKTSLPAKRHIGKCVPLIGLLSSIHFHMKGFPQRFVLKLRYKATRKSVTPEIRLAVAKYRGVGTRQELAYEQSAFVS